MSGRKPCCPVMVDTPDGPLLVTQDYRDRWADRVIAGARIIDVAKAAGVCDKTVYRWVKQRRERNDRD